MAKLSDLIKDAPDIQIDKLMLNSKERCINGMFFCVHGLVFNGHDYTEEAINNGAVCIVYSEPLENMQANIVYIQVDDTVEALNKVANIFYDYPSRKMRTIGVTGTNGKTSTAYSIKKILDHFEKCGYIGTISIEYNGIKHEANYTTPTVVELLTHLKDMADHRCSSVAIEATSQGLHQGRLDAVDFDFAIFTNLSYEHLDYHVTMDDYYAAKKILFDRMQADKLSIINTDDEYGQRLVKEVNTKVVTYGILNEATYQATDIQLFPDHTEFTLVCFGEKYPVYTRLVSRFNVYNLLAALACVHQAGYALEDMIPVLSSIDQIEGRMQQISDGINFNVIIDYAHTPDGQVKFFDYVKAVTPENKRIISVFGSAGKRDKVKRPMLGQIASQYSDIIILTEEDPRDEDPVTICKDIQEGIEDCRNIIVVDRYDAIYQAMMLANEGDTVCILGKGFERFMARKDGREPYIGDDQAVYEIIEEHFKGENDAE